MTFPLRFYSKKRFGTFTYDEFMTTAQVLMRMCRNHKNGTVSRIQTCPNAMTYRAAHITIETDDLLERLESRVEHYTNEFRSDTWQRSLEAQLCIRTPDETEPFMVCLTCDRRAGSKRLEFYGQCMPDELARKVDERFNRSNFRYKTHTGFFETKENRIMNWGYIKKHVTW